MICLQRLTRGGGFLHSGGYVAGSLIHGVSGVAGFCLDRVTVAASLGRPGWFARKFSHFIGDDGKATGLFLLRAPLQSQALKREQVGLIRDVIN